MTKSESMRDERTTTCEHVNYEYHGYCKLHFVWCPDCKEEIPYVEALINQIKRIEKKLESKS